MKEQVKNNIPWKDRLGVKLFALLSIAIFLALLPFAYVVLVAVNSFGGYSAKINEEQIKQQSVEYLTRLSHQQGQKYEEYFNRVITAATLMAQHASSVYDSMDSRVCEPGSVIALKLNTFNNMFISERNSEIITAYWGGDRLTEPITKELESLGLMDSVLKKTKELLPGCQATHIITTSGIGKYYTWNEESKEIVRHLPKPSDFDLRDGEPLTIFTKDKRSTDQAHWTSIYKDDVVDGLMLTASGPIVDSKGIFRGITGIDLPLQKIVDDVLINSNNKIIQQNQMRFAFLVDSRGQIIAFPTELMSIFGFDIDLSTLKNSADVLDFNLKNSRIKTVQDLVQTFSESKNQVLEIDLEGQDYYVATQDLPTLGWTFAIVAKYTDLMSSVEKTQAALDGTLKNLKRGFILNSFGILFLALFLVYFAVRFFIGPLQKLAQIAQGVGSGDLTVSCQIDRRDELGALGSAMNEMIAQLALVDELKENYSARLERDIESRTSDLEEKNLELKEVVRDLHDESERRRNVTVALVESEKQLRSIMASSLISLCIIQDEKFQYVNTAIASMFGYSQEELLNGPSPFDLISQHYQQGAREAIRTLIDTGKVQQTWPYHIQCRRRNGRVFDAQVEAAQIIWKGRLAVVATIVDISPLKKTEHKLLVKEKRLQDSLEEKNILLREVYHRTKNNMLVIISMINLQMDGIEDETAKRVFSETENRIRAMALVHENLYRSKNLAEINLGEYLENMVRMLVKSMTIGGSVRVSCKYYPVAISFERAITVGLVVNELVTNSIKHGFQPSGRGEIRVEIEKTPSGHVLIVADDGIGLPEQVDPHSCESFGLLITANMIEKQLGASFEVDRSHGTLYRIVLSKLIEEG